MSVIKVKSGMSNVEDIAKNLKAAGIPPDFGVDNSRLLIKMWRTLAQGRPVTRTEIVQISEELGILFEQAEQFLRQVTERDSDDNIIGLVGLSLNQDWPHRFNVNGNSLRTWCAWDALFLPPMLGQGVVVESESPVSGTTVRLTVTPEGVTSANPEGAVVTIATFDPEVQELSSVEAIWGNFCHQVYFFATKGEAQEWAKEKSNIAILSVDEGYELGRLAFSELRKFA